MWGINEAGRVAQEALAKASGVEMRMGAFETRQRGHEDGCERRWQELDKRLERDRRDEDSWRSGLGQRLDNQDRLMQRVGLGIIGVLAGIVAVLLRIYVLKG